jgi:hypothetical protein
MVRNSMETETLARLYLDQGHPERALPIFERLLAEDPGRMSAAEGVKRCRAALGEAGMDREKKISYLRKLLSRLTGVAEPEPDAPVSEPAPAPILVETQTQPIVEEIAPVPPPIPSKPLDPRERKIQLLQAMLQRLTEA